ncbi:TMEM175 family protein [uncultured Aquimarina sp.]|uniref:TMEM175 family protein n=1 Tax=uncultured Aquimarina sp. TaxID=575652 RepID=UPI00262E6276|nr:TMEM175 family protein [uncultured Aquimarina sp.]
MKTNRLEAFSDGVLAIIITIMVLELEAPKDITLDAIISLIPVLSSYVISFLYLGTYWNNHHHLFHITDKVSGKILWANLHLLFWLSLIPFATSWIGEHHNGTIPSAFYGFILLMCAIAYFILQNTIVKIHRHDSSIQSILGNTTKRKLSLLLYTIGIGLSFFKPYFGIACYLAVLVLWFIPEKKIENTINN